MRPVATLMISAALLMPCALVAQTHDDHSHAAMQEDSAFRAMQARGQAVMGVDQYTSVHRFDALRDGGRIVLQRDRDDSAGAVVIRAHLRSVARAFSAGDFSSPRAVHVDTVPGTAVMRARRAAIRYEVSDVPRGALLRIRSRDARAVEAIHRFLDYQRSEHHTAPAAHEH
ncbi:MAG: aspartate carbamoyltransferase [Gemmatimonadetes bacterium]|nr:MAG: aspartate carbamoyltransferase [Gemmatimonadota bacterium]